MGSRNLYFWPCSHIFQLSNRSSAFDLFFFIFLNKNKTTQEVEKAMAWCRENVKEEEMESGFGLSRFFVCQLMKSFSL